MTEVVVTRRECARCPAVHFKMETRLHLTVTSTAINGKTLTAAGAKAISWVGPCSRRARAASAQGLCWGTQPWGALLGR